MSINFKELQKKMETAGDNGVSKINMRNEQKQKKSTDRYHSDEIIQKIMIIKCQMYCTEHENRNIKSQRNFVCSPIDNRNGRQH